MHCRKFDYIWIINKFRIFLEIDAGEWINTKGFDSRKNPRFCTRKIWKWWREGVRGRGGLFLFHSKFQKINLIWSLFWPISLNFDFTVFWWLINASKFYLKGTKTNNSEMDSFSSSWKFLTPWKSFAEKPNQFCTKRIWILWRRKWWKGNNGVILISFVISRIPTFRKIFSLDPHFDQICWISI